MVWCGEQVMLPRSCFFWWNSMKDKMNWPSSTCRFQWLQTRKQLEDWYWRICIVDNAVWFHQCHVCTDCHLIVRWYWFIWFDKNHGIPKLHYCLMNWWSPVFSTSRCPIPGWGTFGRFHQRQVGGSVAKNMGPFVSVPEKWHGNFSASRCLAKICGTRMRLWRLWRLWINEIWGDLRLFFSEKRDWANWLLVISVGHNWWLYYMYRFGSAMFLLWVGIPLVSRACNLLPLQGYGYDFLCGMILWVASNSNIYVPYKCMNREELLIPFGKLT